MANRTTDTQLDRRTLFLLTPRRKLIVDLLSRYHYLRSTVFHERLPSEAQQREDRERSVRRSLHDLVKHGYLHSQWLPRFESRSHLEAEKIYWLSQKGLTLADGAFKANREKSPYSLQHEVLITDFHFYVDVVAARLEFQFRWRQHDLKKSHGSPCPDAIFTLTDPARPPDRDTMVYFLEVERSRQGNYRDGYSGLIRKVDRYCEYRNSGQCREDWEWFSDFRLVLALKNEDRMRNLLDELPVALADQTAFVWLTNFARLSADIEFTSEVFARLEGHPDTIYSFLD